MAVVVLLLLVVSLLLMVLLLMEVFSTHRVKNPIGRCYVGCWGSLNHNRAVCRGVGLSWVQDTTQHTLWLSFLVWFGSRRGVAASPVRVPGRLTCLGEGSEPLVDLTRTNRCLEPRDYLRYTRGGQPSEWRRLPASAPSTRSKSGA